MQGRFITFEGPEGSGKSTQIKLLVDRLQREGIDVVCTREPGGTPTGEAIRSILQHDAAGEALSPRAELLLFTASRAQLMERIILPALAEEKWVVCDRFIDSTMAYQGYARSMDIATLAAINAFAINERKPDLTVLLDLDIEEGFRRIGERYAKSGDAHDRFEQESIDFHRKVCAGYRELVEREPDRFRVVDANRSIEIVSEAVWTAVSTSLLES